MRVLRLYRIQIPLLLCLLVTVSLTRNGFASGKEDSLAFYFDEIERIKLTDPETAFHHAQRCWMLSKEQKDIRKQIKSLSLLGETQQYQSHAKASVRYYLRAIHLAKQHHMVDASAGAMNGLGISYYYMNDFEKSEQYILKAADLKKKAGHYDHYYTILTNLSGIYFSQKKYDKALRLLRSIEPTLKRNHQSIALANLYNAIGSVHQMGKNNLDSAAFYFQKSLRIAVADNNLETQLNAYHNLGGVQSMQGNYTLAFQNLNRSLALSKRMKRDVTTMAVYQSMSEAYAAQGKYKEALSYKEKQLEVNNRLFEANKQKAIDELNIRYETADKERKLQQQSVTIERAQNRQNLLFFILAIALLIFAGIFFYFQLKLKSRRQFEHEKSRLFENIVHEIRTPITLINGPLHLLKTEVDEAKKDDYVQMIRHNSDKLIRLVDELLDASKMDSNNYSIRYDNGDPFAFIQRITAPFLQEAKEKNILMERNLPDASHFLCFPADVTDKVISNLLSNALRYCPSGSRIELRCFLEADHLTFVIADNGPGIPTEHQKRIFERFYRIDENSTIAGTGIGLSFVRDLIRQAKGTLTLESDAGKGSCFTITIPVSEPAFETDTSENFADKPVLLLVEDDKDVAAFVRGLLSKDYELISAANGDEAAHLVQENLPDIILSDIMMPVLDGVSLLQIIKENELTEHIPMVLFSAKTSLESKLTGLAYGADAYLPKPFHPDELLLLLQNLLSTARNNRKKFVDKLQKEQPFDERVKSENAFINKAIAFVVAQLDNPEYSVNELAADLYISRSQLHRKLHTLTGFSTTNFIRMIRLEKARDMLLQGAGNVTEIAYTCGFNSQSYFTKSFTEYFGKPPSNFSKNA